MKIAVNTRWLLKDRLEGTGWFTYSLLKRVVRDHPDVEFHFLFDRKPDEEFRFGPNVIFHRVSPPARHHVLWTIWNHYKVPSKLRRIKPDVYFSPDGMGAKGWNGPQLLVAHDLNFEHNPEWIPRKVAAYLQKHMVRYAREADRIICVSNATMEDVNRTWGIPMDRMDVVYNAPQGDFHPVENPKPDLPVGNASYFVCVGAINPRKNLALAVKAFSKYKLMGGNAHLVFVGANMHGDEEMDRVLSESPYTDQIHFVGRKQGEELNEILSASDGLLFPSLFEGFGIPIVEAMAAGTPVITSNVSCMPEIAGKGAIQLSPLEADDWANAMTDIENPEIREEWIRKGIERAKFFDWEISAARLWKNIEQTIDAAAGKH